MTSRFQKQKDKWSKIGYEKGVKETEKWAKESELTFLELLLHLNPSEPVKHQIEIRKKQISGEQGK